MNNLKSNLVPFVPLVHSTIRTRSTNQHNIILEPGSKKHICPSCGKRRYVRYINTETNEYLPEEYGRCDRESNCAYHLNPYKDGYLKKQYDHDFQVRRIIHSSTKPLRVKEKEQKKEISFIDTELLQKSLTAYHENNFVLYLIELFGEQITSQLISKYFIGTSIHWPGSTVFWQIDINGQIRSGKIMLYNSDDGKRIKEPTNHITWAHKAMRLKDFNLKQCLFGEHLLKTHSGIVAIVESEKTAIISSIYFPQILWLACGSLNGLTKERCEVLKGYNVVLFPDLQAQEKWKDKAKDLQGITSFKVSEFLESIATETEIKKGLDLADYLIRYNWKDFTNNDDITQSNNSDHSSIEFEKLKGFPEASHLNYHEDLNKAGYYALLLNAFKNN